MRSGDWAGAQKWVALAGPDNVADTRMMYMVRKQLYIDDWHERDLKRRAQELGVSEAELVRRALDAAFGGLEKRATSYPDRPAAVERLRAIWRAPSSTLAGRFEREWLYDDRENRTEGDAGDGGA
jgi:hypothetical protein